MKQVKVLYDPEKNTLTVWFGDPLSEEASEETTNGVILIKNRSGQVIGFEKQNFASQPGDVSVRFETLAGVSA
ncbi:MAG: DUF2283 domain-containing protein [Anaerolineae bacterium]|nr:DUF2283 domain-containing protein [Anaerolineae bacterium]